MCNQTGNKTVDPTSIDAIDTKYICVYTRISIFIISFFYNLMKDALHGVGHGEAGGGQGRIMIKNNIWDFLPVCCLTNA